MIEALIQEMIERGVPADLVAKTAAVIAAQQITVSENSTVDEEYVSPAAMRMRRMRERNKGVTKRNISVTERNESVTRRNSDVTSVTLKEIPPTPPKENNIYNNINNYTRAHAREAEVQPLAEPKKLKTKHNLPENFEFDEKVIALGEKLGMSADEIAFEFDAMRDWAAGTGEKKVDWNAFARGWLRRNANQARGSPRFSNGRRQQQNQGAINEKHSISAALKRHKDRLEGISGKGVDTTGGIIIDVEPIGSQSTF